MMKLLIAVLVFVMASVEASVFWQFLENFLHDTTFVNF